MNKRAPLACCAIALIAMLGSAAAQNREATIYRCGPDGRDLRDSPCPGAAAASSAHQVEFHQPSDAQTKAARAQAASEAKRADQMQQQRLKREAEEARRHSDAATGIDGLATPASGPWPTATKSPDKPAKPGRPVKPIKPTPKPTGGG
jgi:hypothetical protein